MWYYNGTTSILEEKKMDALQALLILLGEG